MNDDHRKPEQSQEPKIGDGIPRREWLLNLGSAVVLSGFAGIPRDALQTAPVSAAALPPGLYTPSMDHVTHALNSNGPFFPVPPGAETEFVRPRSGPYTPQAFSPEEFRTIRRLVEILLGELSKDASAQRVKGAAESIYDEVVEWIDLVVLSAPRVRSTARNLTAEQRALAVAYFTSEEPVRKLETYEPEKICKEGLVWLDQESRRRTGKDFSSASGAMQLDLVSSIGDARSELSTTNAGTRFFEFLKAESIRGFYTSRLGLKELDYAGNTFYGQSPGCNLVKERNKVPAPK